MAKRNDKSRNDSAPKEFDEVLLEVRRVTRVTTGGRQLSFRAIILIGNRKGKIGIGVAKGADVSIAVKKATHEAYKNIVEAPITDDLSIPYETLHKYKSAQVKLIPAAPGTGLKAGSSVRAVLDLAGYTNMLSKIMGTNNKLNNAVAAVQALASFKKGKSPKKSKVATKEEVSTEAEETAVA
ncbi:MAG: 30S ribosomal protein S5 [Candidatus Peribacteria bacterium]|nr:MAG: 30S ribosomal protein S5 [Candidatus Peribacteria bacterium]